MEKRIKLDTEYLANTKNFLNELLVVNNVEDEVKNDIKLAVVELVTNIKKHSTEKIEFDLRYFFNEDMLCIEIEYTDDNFDRPGNSFKENRLQHNGFGIYLVEKIMDLLEYEYKDNRVKVHVEKRVKS